MGSHTNEPDYSSVKALIVDDVKLHRMIHNKLLVSMGVAVVEAENGKEAVDLCQSGLAFDLILMDLEMPVMDGQQATKILRDMGILSRIVGVTARSKEMEKQAFMEAGLDDFIEKPLNHAKLVLILQEIINNH